MIPGDPDEPNPHFPAGPDEGRQSPEPFGPGVEFGEGGVKGCVL